MVLFFNVGVGVISLILGCHSVKTYVMCVVLDTIHGYIRGYSADVVHCRWRLYKPS